MLAFCQPSCHIRFALPRNKLTGATQQQLTRQRVEQEWGERMLPRSEELSGAHFMPHLTYIWADDDGDDDDGDGDDFAAQNL